MVPSVNPFVFAPVMSLKMKSPFTNPEVPLEKDMTGFAFTVLTQWKKEMQSLHVVPPGYDPGMDAKPKTKSVKRNERKKEKRLQQAALEKGKNLDASAAGDMKREVLPDEDVGHASESVKSLTSQMNELDVSANPVLSIPGDSTETLDPNASSQDIDKRIRALKKKIRQAEAQQQKATSQDMKPEQLEKLAKLEGWHQELKILEGKKSEQAAS
ncbi:partner of Y14 and mago isoform X4 [Ricinus communis]|uniref:partner of Y14 and mago isoform X4 n=1 Tax=Ricinus communis TaxID=3988 RepID=UPI000772B93B|nr:partner of Y14 and mago isoform X4 [Ricinus communis]